MKFNDVYEVPNPHWAYVGSMVQAQELPGRDDDVDDDIVLTPQTHVNFPY